jgi:hypothetical protein
MIFEKRKPWRLDTETEVQFLIFCWRLTGAKTNEPQVLLRIRSWVKSMVRFNNKAL